MELDIQHFIELAQTVIESDDWEEGRLKNSSILLGECYYRMAKIHYDQAALDKAEKLFVKALVRLEEKNDIFQCFKIYGFLIRIYSEMQNSESAEVYITKSEELLDRMHREQPQVSSDFYYNVGILKNYRGLFAEARENFLLSYKKAQEGNDPGVQAKALYSLSLNFFNIREFEMVRFYLDKLAQVLQIIKKDYLYGSMYLLYGNLFAELGDYQKSLTNYAKAMQVLQRKNCWNLYGYVLLSIGILYKKMGEFSKALMHYELASNVCDEKRFRRLASLIRAEIADVNDSNVDLYLDRQNRMVYEKTLGPVDFKHRFVLLEILFLLARNPGQYFNKEDLSKSIWHDEYNPLIHDKLIYTSVSRLRKLIEPKNTDVKRRYILREKDGYMFNPHVKARFHRESAGADIPKIGNVEITSPV